jgi:hypothetical protein
VNEFLLGAIALCCFAVGLFFLSYWRSSRDRFFLFLMLSFWIEAGNRVSMGWSRSWNEDLPVYYLIRLVSYGLILLAIWDKNRSGHRWSPFRRPRRAAPLGRAFEREQVAEHAADRRELVQRAQRLEAELLDHAALADLGTETSPVCSGDSQRTTSQRLRSLNHCASVPPSSGATPPVIEPTMPMAAR